MWDSAISYLKNVVRRERNYRASNLTLTLDYYDNISETHRSHRSFPLSKFSFYAFYSSPLVVTIAT